MSKKIIHVNQSIIQRNRRDGTEFPAVTMQDGATKDYYEDLEILDKDGDVVAKIVYRPHSPLRCGARLWIEIFSGDTNYKKRYTYQELKEMMEKNDNG